MKLHTRIGFWLLLSLAASLGMTGCSSSQLIRQAEIQEQTADTADSGANQIDRALVTGGSLRELVDSPAFQPVRDAFPQLDEIIDNANATGADIRVVMEGLAADLRATAAENRRQGDILRAKAADTNLTEWDRAGAAITAGAAGINPILSLVVGGLVSGIAAWKKGQRNGADKALTLVVESANHNDQIRAGLSNGAGNYMVSKARNAPKPVRKAVLEAVADVKG